MKTANANPSAAASDPELDLPVSLRPWQIKAVYANRSEPGSNLRQIKTACTNPSESDLELRQISALTLRLVDLDHGRVGDWIAIFIFYFYGIGWGIG